MIVVCIKVPPLPPIIEISINKNDILDAYSKEEYLGRMEYRMVRKYWFVLDKLGNEILCDAFDRKEYFITLEEFRNKKISDILS